MKTAPPPNPFDLADMLMLKRLAAGWTDKRIAQEMGWSKGQVSQRLWRLRKQRGFQSRAEMISFCHLAGIVTEFDFPFKLRDQALIYRYNRALGKE